MYRLIFDKKFKKDFDKLDKSLRERVLNKIFQLEKFPELGKHLIGLDLWSLRIGKYRVIYRLDKGNLIILILQIEHRKKAYRSVSPMKINYSKI